MRTITKQDTINSKLRQKAAKRNRQAEIKHNRKAKLFIRRMA